ncbi:FAD-dependent oxidoreductase [Chloroflexota bacterium]
MHFPKLFEPGKIGTMGIKNRVVMAAHGPVERAYTGYVPEREVSYYAERAKGGTGLLITVNICVDNPIGRVSPGMICIDDNKYLTGLAEMVEAVHLWGGKIACQLLHAGRETSLAATEGKQPVSASATTFIRPGWATTARELSPAEINEVQDKFAEGALRAKIAGFDAVELHGAFGHCLIAQFLSPYTNKRIDLYGGSLENRMRFTLELIERTREKVGDDYPLILRLCADEFVPGGITMEETKIVVKKMEEAGVDALNVAAGHTDSLHRCIPPMGTTPEGCFVDFAEEIKKIVSIPIISGGRVKTPEAAEKILAEGKTDFIFLARALIADPEWSNKARLGKVDEIRTCISCNWGCLGAAAVFLGRNMKCDINAAVGKEKEYKLTLADKPKKVLVVGGGPAGMEAARVASLRGHKVTLIEGEKQLGGQLLLASVTPYKTEIGYLTKYLVTQMDKLGVNLILRKEGNLLSIKNLGPDVVVIATGAKFRMPEISGVQKENVYSAWEVLSGKATVKGKKVVVVGGGIVGCEVTEHLALKGKEMTLVMRYSQIGITRRGMTLESLTRYYLLERFTNYGVKTLTERNLEEISDKGLVIRDKKGNREVIDADSVVLALGAAPNNMLTKALEDSGIEFYTIGDAVTPRRISDAIAEGSFIARQI